MTGVAVCAPAGKIGVTMRFAIIMISWPLAVLAISESSAQLTARLLDNYGIIGVRPGQAEADASAHRGEICSGQAPPEQVETQVYVDQYQPLDMLRQTWQIDGFLRAWWTDSRLAYNGTANGGCVDMLTLKTAERARIWKPEFYWEGAKTIELPGATDRGKGELLKIYPDGGIFWSRQVSFLLSCPFSQGRRLEKLPFDTQECTFTMGMYAETSSEVYLRWRSGAIAFANWDHACLAEWYPTGHDQVDLFQAYSSGNYTYAQASVSFSRSPERYMTSYAMTSIIMVGISYLGFYIDPDATPARVALGMLCLLVVMTNFVSLTRSLPPMSAPPWLANVSRISFYFNVVAMTEQVLVSFGLSALKWLREQRSSLDQSIPWKRALVQNKHAAIKLFRLFDENDDDSLSKKEFRRGVQRLDIRAPVGELNTLFDTFDIDNDGTLSMSELERMLNYLEAGVEAADAASKIVASPARPGIGDDGGGGGSSEVEVPSGSQRSASILDAVYGAAGAHVGKTVSERNLQQGSVGAPAPSSGSAEEQAASPQPTLDATNVDVEMQSPVALSARSPVHALRIKSSAAFNAACNSTAQVTALAATSAALASAKLTPAQTEAQMLAAETKREMQNQYRTKVKEDLDRGRVWECKTFVLFPFLAKLTSLDHVFRFVFPLAYIIYLVAAFSEVEFAFPHYALLATSPCYTAL